MVVLIVGVAHFLQVGSSGVGKSSLVRTVAQLTGHHLLELPIISDMDTTDLLGGFEQVGM